MDFVALFWMLVQGQITIIQLTKNKQLHSSVQNSLNGNLVVLCEQNKALGALAVWLRNLYFVFNLSKSVILHLGKLSSTQVNMMLFGSIYLKIDQKTDILISMPSQFYVVSFRIIYSYFIWTQVFQSFVPWNEFSFFGHIFRELLLFWNSFACLKNDFDRIVWAENLLCQAVTSLNSK